LAYGVPDAIPIVIAKKKRFSLKKRRSIWRVINGLRVLGERYVWAHAYVQQGEMDGKPAEGKVFYHEKTLFMGRSAGDAGQRQAANWN